MKPSTRIGLEISHLRQRLNEYNLKEELSAEDRAEMEKLTTRYGEAEVELRAAMAGEEPDEVTERETVDSLDELRSNASVAEIVSGFIEQRSLSGATAEYLQELKLPANTVPLELLETRAATPAPSNVERTEAAVIPAVFPQSVTSFLGIPTPTVANGEPVYPVMTSRPTVSTPAAGASVDESDGTFEAMTLSPKRLQASYIYQIESAARFGAMDSALRRSLSDALADALDKQILTGTSGLFTGAPTAPTAEATYSTYRKELAARVDGRLASTMGDVRLVVGAATYAHADQEFRSATAADDMSALDYLRSRSAGLRVSFHVPAVASKAQTTLFRVGMRMDAVAPLWQGVSLIHDNLTRAKQGEITLTAVMLYSFAILRSEGFVKKGFQVEA